MLKNGKVDPKQYVEHVNRGTVGFEGLHFYLFRMNQAFILIDILWKIMLTHEKEYAIYKYIFEVAINQLFEEYIFVKAVLKGLEERFHEKEDETWIVDFLYFYDHFMWKNKKFVEMYDNYNWFFKNHLIRFPSIMFMDETGSMILNEKMQVYREQIDKRKHFVTFKHTYAQLSELAKSYFKEISEQEDDGEKDWLLFSRKSILNKLEVDMMQKRSHREDRQYVSSIQYMDTEPKYEEEEKETKHSLSERF